MFYLYTATNKLEKTYVITETETKMEFDRIYIAHYKSPEQTSCGKLAPQITSAYNKHIVDIILKGIN